MKLEIRNPLWVNQKKADALPQKCTSDLSLVLAEKLESYYQMIKAMSFKVTDISRPLLCAFGKL